jgi:hypothetical protein
MIPKRIHQTYKHHELPEIYAMCAKQIQALHPDYEYSFYTDDDMYDFMRTEFPTYYSKFMALPRTIMQIDMFRYFLMYKYGGIYADMDYYMLRPFDSLLSHELVLPTNRESADGTPICLGNCIFASRPGHPFWRKLMDSLFTIDRYTSIDFDDDTAVDKMEYGTGQGFVYSMWDSYARDDTSIFIAPKPMFHPPSKQSLLYCERLRAQGAYGMHWYSGVWRNGGL